jgi:hypothetical protein
MTETLEDAQKRRAKARQKRRDDAERMAHEGGTDGARTGDEATGGAEQLQKATGAIATAGQRLTSKTGAAAAVVGASLVAAMLAGRKVLSSRRKGDTDRADER